MLQPFITPVLSRCISARLFSFPRLKINWKGLHFADVAEIQVAVTDELKKVQKEEFSAAFQNCIAAQKSVYMPMDLILNLKKGLFSSIFKKISPKPFGLHCVWDVISSPIYPHQRSSCTGDRTWGSTVRINCDVPPCRLISSQMTLRNIVEQNSLDIFTFKSPGV